ncbi:hypothetical protein OG453_06975 [Streptomyces sp. NBC_01381]|uniref:hypothetical protein n=1 Tax=Streptomyces sp. NBC_01381 TaxID=2903845 RepID=UPI00224E8B9C|nr:hypothetical protein [Streptomyces sp. NBC_01381]MCX4666410.1 hypothetical protein [Streptomyces sp. NBC_01381]
MSDTATPQPIAISPFGLHLLAEDLAGQLDAWNVVDDFEPGQDSSVYLAAPDRRAIGLRLLFNGRAVQAFAIGATAPKGPAGAGEAGEVDRARLPRGVRYSTGVTFIDGETPLESLLTAVRTVLLPAFDGHRPRLRHDGTRVQPEAEPAPSSSESQPVEQAPAKTSGKPKTTKAKSPARRPASVKARKPKAKSAPSAPAAA